MIYVNPRALKELNNNMIEVEHLLSELSGNELDTRAKVTTIVPMLKSKFVEVKNDFDRLSKCFVHKGNMVSATNRWVDICEKYNTAKTKFAIEYANRYASRSTSEGVEYQFNDYFSLLDDIASDAETMSKAIKGYENNNKNGKPSNLVKRAVSAVLVTTVIVSSGIIIGHLVHKNNQMTTAIDQAENENAELIKQIGELSARIEELRDQLSKAKTQEEYDALQAELDKANDEIISLAADKLSYSMQLKTQKEKYDVLLAAFNDATEEISSLQTSNLELVKEIANLNIAVVNKDAEIKTLKEQYSAALITIATLQEQINNSQGADAGTIAVLQAQINVLQKKNEELENQLSQKIDEYAELVEDYQELSETYKASVKENEGLKQENAILQQKIDNLQAQVTASNAKIASLQEQLKNATSSAEYEKLSKELKNAIAENTKLKENYNSLVDKYNQLDSENQANLKTLEQLKQQLVASNGQERAYLISKVAEIVGMSESELSTWSTEKLCGIIDSLIKSYDSGSYEPDSGSSSVKEDNSKKDNTNDNSNENSNSSNIYVKE